MRYYNSVPSQGITDARSVDVVQNSSNSGKPIKFVKINDQLDRYGHAGGIFKTNRHLTHTYVARFKLEGGIPAVATGVLAIVNPFHWGEINKPIALTAMKNSSGWNLSKIPKQLTLTGKLEDFVHLGFVFADSTYKSFTKLAEIQNRNILLILPFRIEMIESDVLRPLAPNEFDLDLASVLWITAINWTEIQHDRTEIEFTALGETYNGAFLTAGFKESKLRINMREPAKLVGCHRIIGVLPSH